MILIVLSLYLTVRHRTKAATACAKPLRITAVGLATAGAGYRAAAASLGTAGVTS